MVLLSFVIFSNFFQLLKTDILALTFSENIKELIYSLKMSFVASFFGTLILVFILNNYDNNLFKLIILSPLLFPGALMGVSIISVFIGSEHYSYLMGKDILLIYSNTIKSLPVIYFFLKGSLDTKDKNIIDCGKIYQKNIFHRIRYIDIPYFLIPILGGIYLGFSYIFGEISSSILLIPPGKQLISLKIYSYLHYGSGSKISALGFIIIAFFTVTTSLILLFINKKRRYIR
jgi:iron(III) transport system permease protein